MTIGSTGETSGCSRDQEARCSGTCLPIQDWLGASALPPRNDFLFLTSRAHLHIFHTNCPCGPHFAQIPPPTPVLCLAVTLAASLWQTPTGQNVWKVDKTFLEVCKKKLFISKEYKDTTWAWILCWQNTVPISVVLYIDGSFFPWKIPLHPVYYWWRCYLLSYNFKFCICDMIFYMAWRCLLRLMVLF